MSDYIFYINKSEISNGEQNFKDGNFQDAERSFEAALCSLYRYNGDQLYPMLLASDLKDKIQLCKWNIRDAKELNTHLGCVLYHLQRFDIEMVNDLLDDQGLYLNRNKEIFIHNLSDALNALKETGDTYLDRIPGFCNSKECHKKKTGFSLVGNKSNMYFDFLFDVKNGIIISIHECNNFKCNHICFDRKYKITIDDRNLPF